MEKEFIKIDNIPAIIWGKKSSKAYIYVHGKSSCKEYAEEFAEIADSKGYQTISFDLPKHGDRKTQSEPCDIWNGVKDLKTIKRYVDKTKADVSLYACSIGAHYSLFAYNDVRFSHCLFQSPIINMPYLINKMFEWFGLNEEQLRAKKVIDTPIDVMTIKAYEYELAHATQTWCTPTDILYGGKDNLQTAEIMNGFVNEFGGSVTISPQSEHPFMADSDRQIVKDWYNSCIDKTV